MALIVVPRFAQMTIAMAAGNPITPCAKNVNVRISIASLECISAVSNTPTIKYANILEISNCVRSILYAYTDTTSLSILIPKKIRPSEKRDFVII